MVGADGVARERHALEQQLGMLLHEDLVDVRAGVALVAVGDDELALAGRVAGELPLRAGGEARAAAAADVRGLDLLEQLLGRERRDRARQARPVVAVGEQHRLVDRDARRRLAAGQRGSGDDAVDDPRPGVDDVAVAHRGRAVAVAQADGLGERDRPVGGALAELAPEGGAQRVDVRVGGRREARRAGADADVARAARLQQVVVERRDAMDGGLGQAGQLGRGAAVVVGDLAVVLDGVLEHLERRRRPALVMAADDLDEVVRHARRSVRPSRGRLRRFARSRLRPSRDRRGEAGARGASRPRR